MFFWPKQLDIIGLFAQLIFRHFLPPQVAKKDGMNRLVTLI